MVIVIQLLYDVILTFSFPQHLTTLAAAITEGVPPLEILFVHEACRD